MILDFERCVDVQSYAADVCIVGSGAAGLTIAAQFSTTSQTVLILEAGGLAYEPETQSIYDSDVIGNRHVGVHTGRARIFGGTTTLWGGQALRMDADEFEAKNWIAHSGWPISRRELDPYYDRAEQQLSIGPDIAYETLCTMFKVQPAPFNQETMGIACSRWTSRPNFARKFLDELAQSNHITILLHANATEVVVGEDGSAVRSVTFSTLGGKRGSATAKAVVLCAGGIEIPRLLLASDRVHSAGVGNSRDLVGRFFQDHLHIAYGNLITVDPRRVTELFHSFYWRGVKYAPKIIPSRARRTMDRMLSIHGEVLFEAAPDSAFVAGKQLMNSLLGRSVSQRPPTAVLLRRIAADPFEALRLAYRLHVKHRIGDSAKRTMRIAAQCETAPDPNSRVKLAVARDRLGMPRTEIDWRIGDLERRTLIEFWDILVGEFTRLRLATPTGPTADLSEASWTESVTDSAHHMGTTRMSDSSGLGVVDRNCRVHGMANLYIGSSSVFPTSTRSNPTLTIMALCIRLADYLKAHVLVVPKVSV